MLLNPARVMKPQLRVVELGEEDAARYKPLKVRISTFGLSFNSMFVR